MRRMDCDQVRPLIGEVVIRKRTLKIYRRRIGQELLHDAEYKTILRSLKKLTDKGKGPGTDEYSDLLNAWLLREIQIFIPEFKKEDFEAIDHDQRKGILAMIFERDVDSLDEEAPKKKGKGK